MKCCVEDPSDGSDTVCDPRLLRQRAVFGSFSSIVMPVLGGFLALIMGGCVFLYRFGYSCLDPSNIAWLSKGDWAKSYLGWLFFRNEPWTFPLGNIASLCAPVGTTVGFTDSNPLVALSLKLFAEALPQDFQYIGLWLLLCYLLQAFFGYLLMSRITPSWVLRLLGVGFFLLSPPLLSRQHHHTLCSHWIILAAFYLYCSQEGARFSFRVWALWSILLVIAGCIHPYLAVMALGLSAAFGIAMYLTCSDWTLGRTALFVSSTSAVLLVVWYTLGYIGMQGQALESQGFGFFSANLNTFVNPQHWSSFLPNLPCLPGQYEGFCYMGIGTILVLFSGAVAAIITRDRSTSRYWIPLVFALSLYFVFALASPITLGETSLITYRLPEPILKIIGMFHSTGRFIWPVYYGVMLAALYSVASMRNRLSPLIVLAVCLCLQLTDLRRALVCNETRESVPCPSTLKSPLWTQLADKMKGIVTYPPFARSISHVDDYRFLAPYAARHGLSISMGPVARTKPQLQEAFRLELERKLDLGELDPRKIYIFQRFSPEFCKQIVLGKPCAVLDDYHICATSDAFRSILHQMRKPNKYEGIKLCAFLDKYQRDIVLLAVKEEAALNFPVEVKRYLEKRGSRIGTLELHGSYVAVVGPVGVVAEDLNNVGPASLTISLSEILAVGGALSPESDRVVALHSEGSGATSRTSMLIEGIEYSRASIMFERVEYAPNLPGINVAVVNPNGEILCRGVFDTHRRSDGVLEILPVDRP